MGPFAISRRRLLWVTATLAATAGSRTFQVSAARVPAAHRPLPDGILVARVLLHMDRDARVDVVAVSPNSERTEVLSACRLARSTFADCGASAWRQAQAAAAYAQQMIAAAAASEWRVPPAECSVQMGRIVHLATGRCRSHRIWVDIA